MPGPMMPGCSKANGQAFGIPDVCKVPAPGPPGFVPTPFPNFGMIRDATSTADTVLIENKDVVVENSSLPSSKGDQAGSMGGMISQLAGNKVTFKKGSSKVFAKGKAVVHLTIPTSHNGMNANQPAGIVLIPSQTKVLVAL